VKCSYVRSEFTASQLSEAEMGPTKVDPVAYARLIVLRGLTGELCRKQTSRRRDPPSHTTLVRQQPPRNLLVVMVWVLLAVVFVYWYLFVR
jgi:hypothetical protein